LVFHAYINKMHGSSSKTPVKNLVRQRCAEGFNSGVKWLTCEMWVVIMVHGLADYTFLPKVTLPNGMGDRLKDLSQQ
jgi:hypothetical protein